MRILLLTLIVALIVELVPASPLAAFGAADDPANDLIGQEQARRTQIGQLNRYNPFADPSNRPLGALPGTPDDPRIERLQELMKSPAVQGYLNFLANPKTRQLASDVVNSPRRGWLFGAELGWIIVFIFFRAWRFSKSRTWYAKAWTGLWTSCLFFGIGGVAIPWGVLWSFNPGPFRGLLSQLMNTV